MARHMISPRVVFIILVELLVGKEQEKSFFFISTFFLKKHLQILVHKKWAPILHRGLGTVLHQAFVLLL